VWKGEERFSSNLKTAKLGGCSPERGKTAATLDKIRRGERPSVARGGSTGVEVVGREVALERGAGAGSVTREWTKDSVTLERLGRQRDREGKRRGEWGGPAMGVPRGAGAVVGPGPDRVPAGRDLDTARAGRCITVRTAA
jgi:hypothetical protein